MGLLLPLGRKRKRLAAFSMGNGGSKEDWGGARVDARLYSVRWGEGLMGCWYNIYLGIYATVSTLEHFP